MSLGQRVVLEPLGTTRYPDSQQRQIREDRLNGTCVVQFVPRAVGSRVARNSEAWKRL